MSTKKRRKKNKAHVKNTNTPSKKSDKMDADEESPQGRSGNERRVYKVRRYLTYLWPPYLLDLVFCSFLRGVLFIYRKVAGQMPMFLEGHTDSVGSKEQNAIEDLARRNGELLSEVSDSSIKWAEENERKDSRIDKLQNNNKRLQTDNQELVKKNKTQLEENERKDSMIDQLENERTHFQTEKQELVRKNETQLTENKRKDVTIHQLENEITRNQTEIQDLIKKNWEQLEENKRKDSRMEQLQTDYMLLQTENAERKSKIESKDKIIYFLQEEFRSMRNKMENEIARLTDKIYEVDKQRRAMENEKQDALRRLSELVSVRLRDNNPNIADLNDQCRPTKLAEMFSELYDNEWTAAYEMLENNSFSEQQAIIFLLDTIMIAYGFCEELVEKSWHDLKDWFLNEDLPGFQQTTKWLKDSRKSKVKNKVNDVIQDFCTIMANMCNKTKLKHLLSDELMTAYFTNCVELCLLMVATDPPVVIACPGWKPIQITKTKVNNPLKQNTTEESPENCQQLEIIPSAESAGGLTSHHGEHQQLQVMTNAESADALTSQHREHQQHQVTTNAESAGALTSHRGEHQQHQVTTNAESTGALTSHRGELQQLQVTTNAESAGALTSHHGEHQQLQVTTNAESTGALTSHHAESAGALTSHHGEHQQHQVTTNAESAGALTSHHGEHQQLQVTTNAESADGSTSDEKQQEDMMLTQESVGDATALNEECQKSEEMANPERVDEATTSNESCYQLEQMTNSESVDDITASQKDRQHLEKMTNPESVDNVMPSNGSFQPLEEMANPESNGDNTASNKECQQQDEIPNPEFGKDKEKEIFDKATFKEYTKRGKFLDFVVWPAMYLEKGGPLLSKGIAQGTKEQHTPPDAKVWTWR